MHLHPADLSMSAWYERLRFGKLAQDTAFVAFWQTARIGAQTIWVILIARLLGPQGYGTFTGAAGLATAIGGFTGLGLGLVMLQDVARNSNLFGDRWRKAIVVCIASGLILALLFIGCASVVLDHRLRLSVLIAIAISELVFFPIVSVAAFAFSARHQMGIAAALPALMAVFRVLAAVVFWLTTRTASLEVYVWFHAIATLLCACVAWLWVTIQLRPERTALVLTRRSLSEGFGFSMVWMTNNALISLDKTLVLRICGAEIAGLYAALYRFAAVLALPVEALTMAAGPRLFRHGGGIEQQPSLIPRLLLSALVFGALMGTVLWACIGILPWLLGNNFQAAVGAARWMALFVPCYGVRLLGSNVLMTSDCKRLRVLIEGCGLALLIILALAWLPGHGLKGAIAMITTTEAVLALATWLVIVIRANRKESQPDLA
jgi:O-antigen/teichoic acid export membrane protein